MELNFSEYLALFFAALIAVGLLTPLVRKVALRIEILDAPTESHKTHKEAIPYLGGVAIIIGTCLTTYLAIVVSGQASALSLVSAVLIPAVLMGVIGLVDDIKKLSPWPRFIAQNLFGLVIAIILIATSTLGSPTGNTLIDVLITIIWIVGITNSINFFDNVDGGASGTVAISSLFLFFLSLQGGQYAIAALSLVLTGATIGFLLWNRPPARIYMGDAGALFLGILIATLTLRFDPNPINLSASFALPILLLAVPILDTSVAVISRLRRRISPFQGGQDHLSHRLMRAGLSKRQAVLSLWLISAFYCFIAVAISNAPFDLERVLTGISGLIWLLMLILFLKTSDSSKNKKGIIN
jgi:UDP-GlcNAc:undecaprenyl-phosphate/decaprenyl-phosphate GlcNAc-1-phosphate transferase